MLTADEERGFQELLKRIGSNLRRYRISRKETQSVMSERIGINVKSYQRLEYGDFAISTRNLYRLSRRLGIPVEKLVTPHYQTLSSPENRIYKRHP